MNATRYNPDLEGFKKKAASANIVPVCRDILADMDTPVSAFLKIDSGKDAFLLESVEGGEKQGRYSFLGIGPRAVLKAKARNIEILEHGQRRTEKGDPIAALKTMMADYRAAQVEGMPRFSGGAIGHMGYGAVRYIERLPDIAEKDLDVPDMCFIFTDALLAFDNIEHKIKVISNAYIEEGADPEAAYRRAIEKIDSLVDSLRRKPPERKVAFLPSVGAEVTSNFSKKDFLSAIRKAKKYIVDGDIIQAVLSQRFSTALDVDPFDIYRALRVVNPSPYMFFLRLADMCLVGSSPEILVRADGNSVNVRPIAGTRKRGRDEAEDALLEKELLSDPKERAEHIMLVDLGRNDLGKVCDAGTVLVDNLMTVEKYSHVMHIVSNVKGRLMNGYGPFDSLRACFPAGTLTGAPKIRAMEIIEELEPVKRGVYGGSIGYFSYSGGMDMCIAIRTMVIKGGRIYMQAGAGIVADSVPEKEYEETVSKATALLKAVELAREGF